ncbi:MAG TPA: patatin-like phospholipase family protein [Burkholderiales bacterium]|nr:patatin-like phospholipase family protein [Burkholderiales bacterium]
MAGKRIAKKRITLALQGGGSHGAFTWGVLDKLLEDERIEIEGISGASAGAINAALLAHGITLAGNAGGRAALSDFWRTVASKGPVDLIPAPWSGSMGVYGTNSHPAVNTMVFLSRFFSPYQINPFNLNPLRDILSEQINFEFLRSECKIKLFIAATQVSTGQPRMFSTAELDLEVLLASSCLPSLHHPVEVDAEAYWDGGFTANPPLHPLLYECSASDIVMVILQPHHRSDTPKTADEISRRLTEISFTSALSAELRGIAYAKMEAERGMFHVGRLDRRLCRLNLHAIDSQNFMSKLSVLSKFNINPPFIEALRKRGRSHAAAWLSKNFRLIGARSSFTVETTSG